MGRKFWQMRAAANESGVGELLLYGLIGPDDGMGWLFDEITPKDFAADLEALGEISELRVFINSEGGDVFAGQAIHSMLKRHSAHVTVYVDGLAASIASVVAMAGDRVVMPSNAMMMVHSPWTIAAGNAGEFRKMAETLDQVRESLIAAYQGKTSMDREELLGLLEAETWMTAEEAVEFGFADEVEESKQIAAALVGDKRVEINGVTFDLGRFRNAPMNFPRKESDDGMSSEPTGRDIEKALRDAGLSSRDAKTLMSRGWKALASARDEQPEDADVSEDAQQVEIEYEALRASMYGVPV